MLAFIIQTGFVYATTCINYIAYLVVSNNFIILQQLPIHIHRWYNNV